MFATSMPTDFSQPHLPIDLFYPIFALLPKNTLLTLAHTSRATRRPAESLLYRSVSLRTKRHVREFCESVVRCAKVESGTGRLGPLVTELCLGQKEGCVDEEDDEFRTYEAWFEHYTELHGAFQLMPHLSRLTIHYGTNEHLGWVLLDANLRLRSLACGFILDREFLAYLASEDAMDIDELEWWGCEYLQVCEQGLSYELESSNGDSEEKSSIAPLESENMAVDADNDVYPYISCPTTSLLLRFLPHTSLPCLSTLQCTSLPLARALVPGRPVKRLWVPGVDAGVDVTNGVGLERFWSGGVGKGQLRREVVLANGYGDMCIGASEMEDLKWEDEGRAEEGKDEVRGTRIRSKRTRKPRYPQRPPSAPTPSSPPTESHLTSHLLSALQDFSLSTGPLLSFRMTLNFSPLNAGSVSRINGAGFGLGIKSEHAVRAIFECITRKMGELRSLGFVDLRGGSLGGWGGLESPTHPILTPLSTLRHLRTIALWAILSPEDMLIIQQRCSRKLKIIACLGFAYGWKYLCIPVNVNENIQEEGFMGSIGGKKDCWDEERREVQMRKRIGKPYAQRDGEDELWREFDV